MYIKDPLERQFYMEMCRIEHWDTRTLSSKIDGQLYQRTAISQRPEEVIKIELDELRDADTLNPDIVFRSTYFLDMLGLLVKEILNISSISCLMIAVTFVLHSITRNSHQRKSLQIDYNVLLPLLENSRLEEVSNDYVK